MRISDWSSDVCSSDLFAGMAERGWWGYLIEGVGQSLEPLAQRGRPTVGEKLELLIIRLDPGSHAEVEGVPLDHRQVPRHPHRPVGAKRRIHRHQHRLGRILQAGFALADAIEDGLAIFMLAALYEGRVQIVGASCRERGCE